MGKLEKTYVVFFLVYIVVYIFFFFNSIKAPESFEKILPFHFLGMALSLGFIIIVIRDVFKRKFSNPNSKAIWAVAIIIFWPSVFLYLPMYGFKTRDVIHETGNNKKYIIGFIVIVLIFFGFVGYSMYSIYSDFQSINNSEKTINALAASGKNDEILIKLKSKSLSNEELNGKDNESPLHSATINNRPSTVKILVDHGAIINQKDKCNGDTPLHVAARQGYYEVVKVLLDAGAEKTILNDNNKTAFDLAREGGYTATAELLSMKK